MLIELTSDVTTPITGIHPYADKFPMLPDAELAELAESIRSNGLRSPIVITLDGLILDGRNRYAACQIAEVQPSYVEYDGADLAEYVIDCNVTRRNMSTGARAMATALVLQAAGRRVDGRWDNPGGRGKKVDGNPSGLSRNTWREAMAQAGIILDYLPDLALDVTIGAIALDAAYKQACDVRDEERKKLAETKRLALEESEAQEFIADRDPELAAQVGAGLPFRTYAEAKSVWEQRNREAAAKLREEARRERELAESEKRGRAEHFGQMTRALMVLGGYGEYEDMSVLVNQYDPDELNPPSLSQYLTPEWIAKAHRFTTWAAEWSRNNAR